MSDTPEKKRTMDRREMFRTVGRASAAGALGVLGAVLAVRANRGGVNPADHVCVNDSICNGCPKYSGCILPAATSARKAGRDRT
ncbi:MAG: hypothetical protein ACLFV7_07260 [Phycisphaerae bacterium]